MDIADLIGCRHKEFYYLAFRTLLVGWVQEDPSIDQGAVNVCHHGAHVPCAVRGTAILEGRGRRDKIQGI